jgi:hypothetical protein
MNQLVHLHLASLCQADLPAHPMAFSNGVAIGVIGFPYHQGIYTATPHKASVGFLGVIHRHC